MKNPLNSFMITDIILYTLAFAGLMPTAIGLLTMFHWFRPQHEPADTSNRINKIRLWWFALTREELFVPIFPWLKHDEMDNMEGKG